MLLKVRSIINYSKLPLQIFYFKNRDNILKTTWSSRVYLSSTTTTMALYSDPCQLPEINDEQISKFKEDGYIQFEKLIDLDLCATLNAKLEDVLRGKYDVPGGKPVITSKHIHIKKQTTATLTHTFTI